MRAGETPTRKHKTPVVIPLLSPPVLSMATSFGLSRRCQQLCSLPAGNSFKNSLACLSLRKGPPHESHQDGYGFAVAFRVSLST